jgi:hypothetical protein
LTAGVEADCGYSKARISIWRIANESRTFVASGDAASFFAIARGTKLLPMENFLKQARRTAR